MAAVRDAARQSALIEVAAGGVVRDQQVAHGAAVAAAAATAAADGDGNDDNSDDHDNDNDTTTAAAAANASANDGDSGDGDGESGRGYGARPLPLPSEVAETPVADDGRMRYDARPLTTPLSAGLPMRPHSAPVVLQSSTAGAWDTAQVSESTAVASAAPPPSVAGHQRFPGIETVARAIMQRYVRTPHGASSPLLLPGRPRAAPEGDAVDALHASAAASAADTVRPAACQQPTPLRSAPPRAPASDAPAGTRPLSTSLMATWNSTAVRAAADGAGTHQSAWLTVCEPSNSDSPDARPVPSRAADRARRSRARPKSIAGAVVSDVDIYGMTTPTAPMVAIGSPDTVAAAAAGIRTTAPTASDVGNSASRRPPCTGHSQRPALRRRRHSSTHTSGPGSMGTLAMLHASAALPAPERRPRRRKDNAHEAALHAPANVSTATAPGMAPQLVFFASPDGDGQQPAPAPPPLLLPPSLPAQQQRMHAGGEPSNEYSEQPKSSLADADMAAGDVPKFDEKQRLEVHVSQLGGPAFFSIVLLTVWDNVIGPRIQRVWRPSETEAASHDTLYLIADRTLKGEMGCWDLQDRAASEKVKAKFYMMHELNWALVSYTFVAQYSKDPAIYAMSFGFPLDRANEYMAMRHVVDDQVRWLVGRFKVLKKTKSRCAVRRPWIRRQRD